MYSQGFSTLRLVDERVDKGTVYDLAFLIRMKNEAVSLKATIDSISRQIFTGSAVVVFLDSGSTDNSIEIAASIGMPYLIYSIHPKEFQFGATCNLVAELALPTRYFMFLSGHVVLHDSGMIGTSVAYMDENPSVAGLGFRQVPNEATGFNLYEQMYLRRTFPRLSEEYVDVDQAGAFSNAASLVRASAWQDVPFEPVIASEDQIWADAAKARGFQIRYTSKFDVAHSHNETPAAVFKRVRINKVARFGTARQPIKSIRTFFGILVVLLIASKGLRPRFAIIYAIAHASAYMFSRMPLTR